MILTDINLTAASSGSRFEESDVSNVYAKYDARTVQNYFTIRCGENELRKFIFFQGNEKRKFNSV